MTSCSASEFCSSWWCEHTRTSWDNFRKNTLLLANSLSSCWTPWRRSERERSTQLISDLSPDWEGNISRVRLLDLWLIWYERFLLSLWTFWLASCVLADNIINVRLSSPIISEAFSLHVCCRSGLIDIFLPSYWTLFVESLISRSCFENIYKSMSQNRWSPLITVGGFVTRKRSWVISEAFPRHPIAQVAVF